MGQKGATAFDSSAQLGAGVGAVSIADRGEPSPSGGLVPRDLLQSRLVTFAKSLFLVDLVYVTLFLTSMALDPEVGIAGIVAAGAWLELIPELALWSIAWAVFASRPLSTRTLETLEFCLLLGAGTVSYTHLTLPTKA